MITPLLKKFEKAVILYLIFMMVAVVLISTIELAYIIIKDIIAPPIFWLEIQTVIGNFRFLYADIAESAGASVSSSQSGHQDAGTNGSTQPEKSFYSPPTRLIESFMRPGAFIGGVRRQDPLSPAHEYIQLRQRGP